MPSRDTSLTCAHLKKVTRLVAKLQVVRFRSRSRPQPSRVSGGAMSPPRMNFHSPNGTSTHPMHAMYSSPKLHAFGAIDQTHNRDA